MKKQNIFLSVLILIVILALIIDPKENLIACLRGITLWANNILPALFPFFFLTALLNSLGFISKLGRVFSPITSKLFKTSGVSGYVYLMSVISGYPVGAKTTAELYEKGVISRGQAHKITTFTSTSGPLFVVGTVGVGMFNNARLGYVILLAHILGAFLNGILYRNTYKESVTVSQFSIPQKQENILEDAMFGSIKNILVVGGYIVIFYVFISLLLRYNIFTPINQFLALITSIKAEVFNSVLCGVTEVTTGCLNASLLHLSTKKALYLCTGLISFGGISIFLQALTFLKKFNISIKFYLLSKTTQTIISVVIAIILGEIFF